MISHLKGTVEKILENSIVIDVSGVGYEVICSSRTLNIAREKIGAPIHVLTILNVREDAWTLFGFSSEQEKKWFNVLVSVPGVGGKVAMALLSALNDDEIYRAFLTNDKTMLTRADGVGPKLASRLISELKDKIAGKIELHAMPVAENIESSVIQDVISAVANLGYQRSEILNIVSNLDIQKDENFEQLFKKVLGKLSLGA